MHLLVLSDGPNWELIGTAFGSALFGAAVGAIGALMLDVWRRALDGISAARLVRLELTRNRTVVSVGLENHAVIPSLSDLDWSRQAIVVLPLMDEIAASRMSRDTSRLARCQTLLNAYRTLTGKEKDDVRDELVDWSKDLSERAQDLRKIEKASQIVLMRRLLRGPRSVSNAEMLAAFGPDLSGRY